MSFMTGDVPTARVSALIIIIIIIMSSYNALYPPNVGAQSAESIITPAMPGFPHIEVHMANKE